MKASCDSLFVSPLASVVAAANHTVNLVKCVLLKKNNAAKVIEVFDYSLHYAHDFELAHVKSKFTF